MGWTLEYMNGLPEEHLLFVYHWLQKVDDDQFARLSHHLGTMWSREELERLNRAEGGAKGENPTIFVPLSLVVNPELPEALLGKKKDGPSNSPQEPLQRGGGDGLHTEMSIPTDTEVVNMADLTKDEFFGLIGNAGLATTKS